MEAHKVMIDLSERWHNRDKAKNLPTISREEYMAIKEKYAVHFSPQKRIVVVSGFKYFRMK